MSIRTYLGPQALGVLAHYRGAEISIHICGVFPSAASTLRLFFPKGHDLKAGDLATVHLDNRSGVVQFDENLSVYRMSYKGRVVTVEDDWAFLEPRECQVFHGDRVMFDLRQPGYRYPDDDRPLRPLPPSPLTRLPAVRAYDHVNKLGVLVTMAPEQPHTTLLAFLSSNDEDIFFITAPQTFKSALLKRDARCFFVVDERASFTFERAIDWNYTIIDSDAYGVPRNTALFEEVRQAFIAKNPWEIAFFVRDDLEMVHLRRRQLLCSGEFCVLR